MPDEQLKFININVVSVGEDERKVSKRIEAAYA